MHSDSPLVSVEWLVQNLDNPKLLLLDASMDQVVGTAPLVYEQCCCIPGARQCDLENRFIDKDSPLPHTLPSETVFTQQAQRLGINADSIIVIYDNQGIYAAPRAWWMFRIMGHEQVYVVDGGLPEWQRQGHATGSEFAQASRPGDIQGVFQPQRVCSCAQLLNSLGAPHTEIIDARSEARFYGQAPEPRPGLRGGHIPGSVNLPFLDLMQGFRFLPRSMLAERFAACGVSSEDRLIFSCGSGITACIVLLAAAVVGYQSLGLYDGSWSEWGANHQLPID
ncbi:sulfurtransferase [Nitrincola iocasae]|uniref:Sulfurtransferase n=1 Tax=Nitrincola iocasae TaxID=2614693 RepID=A0A5J6LD68_9GAMM|nr:sulfurtransferase [Nitrincola iocasae]QEW06559.1 sulfurtransferase [Nitrincola iocasae]